MNNYHKLGLVFNLRENNAMALAHVDSLAQAIKPEVHILCPASKSLSDSEQLKIQDHIRKNMKYPFNFHVLVGKPIAEILEFSDTNRLDMLILESNGANGLQQFFFGSLPVFLVRRAKCPVWVVKTALPVTYERVLIAVDPLHDQNEAGRLNDKLIELGTFLAKHQMAECHLVSAWHLPGEDTLHSSPFIHTSEEEIVRLRAEEKKVCEKAYKKMLKRNETLLRDTHTHLVNGEPAQAIIDFIHDNKIDIVIMGTVARAGIKGFVIGNTAETLLHQIQCSVITMKPDD